jgi:hypothetical protein
VSAPYRALHAYLRGRFADTVVLTFAEIEDLLGWTLPEAARVQVEWWEKDGAESEDSPQSRAWTQASRTAKPHLFARRVVFDRVPA